MNRRLIRISAAALTIGSSLSMGQQALSAQSCEGLAQLRLPETVDISAQKVPAGPFTLPHASKPLSGGDLPEFCRVKLRVQPQINIEIWLPTATWNERYRGEGGGYYVGTINHHALAKALRAGYATASTDTGHTYSDIDRSDPARLAAEHGEFALNPDGSLNDQLILDFASRSLHQMALRAKQVIRAYYGRPPRYSYWNGCSSGGREGLMAVQRFPEEYDGVLAGCPAINWDRFMLAGLWPQTVMQQEVGHPIDAAKLQAVTQASIAACDGKDGVADGIIDDPRQCLYDAGDLLCARNNRSPTCLTPQEVSAVRKIWQGPTSAKGERLWFGLERGAPFDAVAAAKPGDHPHGFAHIGYWLKQRRDFDWRSLKEADYESNLRLSYRKFNKVIGTDEADLSAFKKYGGKMIIFHGESDRIIFPRGAVHYFERVLAVNGGVKEVNKFARLFMLPGVDHDCDGDDTAPFPQNFFTVLTDWVEKGLAPDRITASQKLPHGAMRTRPLCSYPNTATWNGRGSTDDAANFDCVEKPRNPNDFSVVDLADELP